MGWIVEFKRGDDRCKHAWGDEQGDRHGDLFMWWRVCTKCGEKRPTRSVDRRPAIRIVDSVDGMSYVIGSRQNLANTEFRYLCCECGKSIKADFDVAQNGRVTRKTAVVCDWCGARYGVGSHGPDHRPRAGEWADAPEVE